MAKYPIPQAIIDTREEIANLSIKNNLSPSFALHDFDCAITFLKQYSHNQATFEAYRREIERLLQWTWLIAQKSILDLKREDMENYIAFCLNPPKTWIGLKRTPRFILHQGNRKANPAWRPFVAHVSKQEHKQRTLPNKNHYQLSQKALQEIFTVLRSFYQYLLLEEKVTQNPIALMKQKSKYLQKQQTQKSVMRLSESQWQCCLETAKIMAEEESLHERTLFMLSAFYLLYLRISELAANERWTPQMGHFYQDSHHRWWFKTVGKGNKMRDIVVSDEMLMALKRYRRSLGLSLLPLPNESTPLLLKEKGKGPVTNTRYIRKIIQLCFDKAAVKLRKEHFISEADALEAATVHWLRHTGISDDINQRGRPIAHVRDDAGHSSSLITDRYNDITLAERHDSAKRKKMTTKKSNSQREN